jgi:pyruvate/2-oxoglutarate dehydrogenase complex dihydrolipoamide acyltransferase (E2) component
MATTIKMPQLGESVTEGTIERWLVKEGDTVEQYDPLFEVVTDKVNAEVPAEVAGTVTKIIVGDGETVKVGTPLAEIDAGNGASAAASPEASAPAEAPAETAAPEPAAPAAAEAAAATTATTASAPPPTDSSMRMTPAVRRLVREHNVDLSLLSGSGAGGRVTREEVLALI